MRTIPALFAAGLSALTLSGSALAAERPGRIDEGSPTWLEARTAFAAQDLWPQERPGPSIGQQISENGKVGTTRSLHTQDSPVGLALRQAVGAVRHWGTVAKKALEKDRFTTVARD